MAGAALSGYGSECRGEAAAASLCVRRVGTEPGWAEDAPRKSAVAGSDEKDRGGRGGYVAEPSRNAGRFGAPQRLFFDYPGRVAAGAIATRGTGCSRVRLSWPQAA